MTCSLCGQRKARRACPALERDICTVCCATKRLVEIDCPSTCPHLVAAREHPAASVKRQQERDVMVLMPSIAELTERQYQLFFLLHTAIARYKPEGFSRLVDNDVAQAAAALASTLETAARGVIYEHTPESRAAQGLVREFQALLAEVREHGAKVYDGEVAIVLRAIERGAEQVGRSAGEDTGYLSLMGRLLNANRAAQQRTEAGRPQSSLILP